MKQRLEAFLKGAIEGLTGEMRLEQGSLKVTHL